MNPDLDEPKLTARESRAEFEGNPSPVEMCGGCGYGFATGEDGNCPKCHSGAREPATAFCEVPLADRLARAKAEAKAAAEAAAEADKQSAIDKACKALLLRAAKKQSKACGPYAGLTPKDAAHASGYAKGSTGYRQAYNSAYYHMGADV